MVTSAAIYARVSTDTQTHQNQTEVLTAWAKQRGYDLDAIYSESETAWVEGHQRELSRLLNEAKAGRIQVILVWSLDRVSRQGSLAILDLVNRLNKWGVKLLSYQEPWTDAPGQLGEVLYALAGWVARMESQRRSERTKAGLERKKRGGWVAGRPAGSKDKRIRKRRVARHES